MSMSKKIFSVILLLIVIAMAITGIAIYSIDRLGDSLQTMSGLANRSINYNVLSSLQLRRRINLQILLAESDAEAMKGPAKRLEEIGQQFQEELVSLQGNMPAVMSQAQSEAVPGIQQRWAKYVEATDEIARLALANSNNEAVEIFENSEPFWNSIDEKIEAVV